MKDTNERLHLERKFKKGKIPYAIDSSFKRCSERNTIFSRVVWDESFKMYMHPINEREAEKVDRIKGFSREGYAASSAAWTVYDQFPKAFAWDIEQESEHSPTQKFSKLPQYDSSNIDKNSQIVKRIAQVFGVCKTGITKIDPDQKFIYTHNRRNQSIELPDGVEYAIVMLIEMDYKGIKTSPMLPASIITGNGYSRMAFAIACMAEFIRNLGYRAVPAGNDTGLSVPLAIKAGLGQLGRNGLLINPKYGQRVRICKVYTDLPLKIDQPVDFGATQFCRVCKKCAQYCPSQSIPFDTDPTWDSPWDTPSNNSGSTYKWYVNADTCYEFWVKNSSDCSNCIRVCPFTKPDGIAHDIARFFIKHFRFLDRMWVWMDNFMAIFPFWHYGKKHDPEKFWRSKKFLGRKQ
ncbi:MAG: reductive dehalogenase [Candidatus Hodarchaeota archaeon]